MTALADSAHRVVHKTRFGARETLRVFGGPDRDTVAMYVANLFGSTVESVEPVDGGTRRVRGEMDFQGDFANPLPLPAESYAGEAAELRREYGRCDTLRVRERLSWGERNMPHTLETAIARCVLAERTLNV